MTCCISGLSKSVPLPVPGPHPSHTHHSYVAVPPNPPPSPVIQVWVASGLHPPRFICLQCVTHQRRLSPYTHPRDDPQYDPTFALFRPARTVHDSLNLFSPFSPTFSPVLSHFPNLNTGNLVVLERRVPLKDSLVFGVRLVLP